jgi:hypothetical protein
VIDRVSFLDRHNAACDEHRQHRDQRRHHYPEQHADIDTVPEAKM